MAIEKDIIINVKEQGVDELQSKVSKLDTSLENLEDTNKNLSKTMEGTQQSVLDNGGAMGLLNDATGGLAMTVKDAVEASALFAKESKMGMAVQRAYTFVMGASSGAMKVFKLALIGTGIGAIVIALVMLIANFTKVKEAVYNLIPGLKSVGEFFGNLINSITDFIGFTSEAERALAELTKQADKSLAMNKKFMEEQGYFLDEFTKKKIEAKNKYLEAIKQEGADQRALAIQLNAQLADIDKERIDANLKRKQEEADKAADARKAERDRIENERKEQYEKDQKIINDRNALQEKLNAEDRKRKEDGNKALQEVEEEQEQDEMDAEDRRIELAQKTRDERIKNEQLVRDAKFEIANQTMNVIGMLAKKGSKIAKGVAAAQALMNTYQGITAALAAPSTIPEPFGFALKLANAASVGVMGLLNVKNILSTDESGASAGGGATVQGPAAPSFNLVQGTGSNQIAQGLDKQSKPIKAFVVTSDVSTGQEMDRKIIAGASL